MTQLGRPKGSGPRPNRVDPGAGPWSPPAVRRRFREKGAARQAAWDALEAAGAARFPYPPHGRIPNFDGAAEAAARLLDRPPLSTARRVKVNPDAPQRPLRRALLERGVVLYMPTPRLRGGFMRLDPARIPRARLAQAASLYRAKVFAETVAVADLPPMDAIVCGSVAVTRGGRRAGKGEGYGDIEYALLRELGHPPPPVVTTVHDLQVVDALPRDPNDLPLHLIATPSRLIEVKDPPPPPPGIDWSRLDEEDLAAMPVLAELRDRRR